MIKIQWDGGPAYTAKVTDSETGELVHGVTMIEIVLDARNAATAVRLTFSMAILEAMVEKEATQLQFGDSSIPVKWRREK